MLIQNKGILTFMLSIILIGCAQPSFVSTNRVASEKTAEVIGNDLEANQYAVYDATINKLFLNGNSPPALITIYDHTSLDISANYSSKQRREIEVERKLQDRLKQVRQSMPEVSEDVINDLLAKNKESILLKQAFKLKVKVMLLTPEDVKSAFNEGYWESFYRKYPSQGLMTLSNVGFNHEMNQSLVYVGNMRGGLDGIGRYILLTKENGEWKVKDDTSVWVS